MRAVYKDEDDGLGRGRGGGGFPIYTTDHKKGKYIGKYGEEGGIADRLCFVESRVKRCREDVSDGMRTCWKNKQ